MRKTEPNIWFRQLLAIYFAMTINLWLLKFELNVKFVQFLLVFSKKTIWTNCSEKQQAMCLLSKSVIVFFLSARFSDWFQKILINHIKIPSSIWFCNVCVSIFIEHTIEAYQRFSIAKQNQRVFDVTASNVIIMSWLAQTERRRFRSQSTASS